MEAQSGSFQAAIFKLVVVILPQHPLDRRVLLPLRLGMYLGTTLARNVTLLLLASVVVDVRLVGALHPIYVGWYEGRMKVRSHVLSNCLAPYALGQLLSLRSASRRRSVFSQGHSESPLKN